jgi:VWFA-related protein
MAAPAALVILGIALSAALAPPRSAAAAPAAGAAGTAAGATPPGSAASPPGAEADDPVLWPETQRAFFQDGPQLLLTETQRGALARLDAGARQRWIDDFLAHGPAGASAPVTALREGVARRKRLAMQFPSPLDVRAQLLFLDGRPAERKILDCGTTFKPLEVWTWRTGTGPEARSASIVVYQPVEDEPFRAWDQEQGKRALYSSEMEYWLEQWDELHGITGQRFDLRLCKEAQLVDRVTGIPGLGGKRSKSPAAAASQQPYGQRAGGYQGEGLLDPPADLAAWARQAAATELPPPPAALAVKEVEVQFPERSGLRMDARLIAAVVATGRLSAETAPETAAGAPPSAGAAGTPPAAPAAPPAGAPTPAAVPAAGAAAGGGKQLVSLTVEGAVETEGKVFETFHLRYRLPAPPTGQPVAIAVDRSLRSHRAFAVRMRITDDASGAAAEVVRGFLVPGSPTAPPRLAAAVPPEGAEQRQQRQRLAASPPPDTVALEPPEEDVVFGLWRTQALITGNRIVKIAFSVDGKVQLTRHSAPYTVELRLTRLPTEQVVRADGYDAQGALVASDQLVVNQPHGGLAVAIKEPARGARPSGRVRAAVEVTVPSERRVEQVELRLNDTLVAKLTQPPWAADIDVPGEGDTIYLTATAQLDDGSRAEDVRFLRSPQYVEEVAVNLVELYTTVLDGSGKLVKGLTGDDFQVIENGQPQALARFELVENLPLTLGILIDTSGSMASSLGEAQRAAGGFLERMVRHGDRCFTLTFSDRPVLRMPLTDDPRAAAESLEKLQADGSTSIHDALVQSLYYFRGTRGQRALVLLSDGDDNTSQLTFDEALEYAKRSGVAIFTIGLNIPARNLGIRGKLNHLSEVTGGRVFYVNKAEQLAGIYGEIETELRSRYLLAFQSGSAAGAGGYRQIEVRMRKAGLKARTARGYYP